jgi:hypothetical protein
MVLVLSPTRELAQQIAHESELLCTYHKYSTVVLVGECCCLPVSPSFCVGGSNSPDSGVTARIVRPVCPRS